MSFPVLTSGGGQIGTGLIYSNVVYFPTYASVDSARVVSWTIPPGVTTCRVRLWGGGGGAPGSSLAGGGGGFAIKTVTGLTPGGTVTVTIGTGGQANNPGTGGTSSFGAYVSATGGRNTPSTGGAGSGGDINMNGAATSVAGSGGNAGNLFIPFTGVLSTEILYNGGTSGFAALTLMGNPTNPLDKIGTGYLFGIPSTAVFGNNQFSLTIVASPVVTYFGNGAGGNTGTSGYNGTYPGGGGTYGNSGGAGLVVVEY